MYKSPGPQRLLVPLETSFYTSSQSIDIIQRQYHHVLISFAPFVSLPCNRWSMLLDMATQSQLPIPTDCFVFLEVPSRWTYETRGGCSSSCTAVLLVCCCWLFGMLFATVAQELSDVQQKKSTEEQLEETKGRIVWKVFQGWHWGIMTTHTSVTSTCWLALSHLHPCRQTQREEDLCFRVNRKSCHGKIW